VINRSSQAVFIALILTETNGERISLNKATIQVPFAGKYRYPPCRIKPGLGKEQIDVFVSATTFPVDIDGLIGQGKYLGDHGRMIRKTIDIETRAPDRED
jgi:hypothetical protein